MKYYLHDSNSFNDERITEVYINFGYEGLGLFYTILEKFASQEKPIKTIVLKKQLGVGKRLEKCWNFLEQIGLIQTENGESFNIRILNFAGKYKIKNKKNSERVSQWRENQLIEKNVTHYKDESNADKVNKSKVNENINIIEKINKFRKPEIYEVQNYFEEQNHLDQYDSFFNYYESNGWKVGKNCMKDWKAAARNWIKNSKNFKKHDTPKSNFDLYAERRAELHEIAAIIDRERGISS